MMKNRVTGYSCIMPLDIHPLVQLGVADLAMKSKRLTERIVNPQSQKLSSQRWRKQHSFGSASGGIIPKLTP